MHTMPVLLPGCIVNSKPLNCLCGTVQDKRTLHNLTFGYFAFKNVDCYCSATVRKTVSKKETGKERQKEERHEGKCLLFMREK